VVIKFKLNNRQTKGKVMRSIFSMVAMAFLFFLSLQIIILKADEEKNDGINDNSAEIPLAVFSDTKSCEGWKANAWGGGKCNIQFATDKNEKFSPFMKIDFEDAKATLSNTRLFQDQKSKWLENPVTGAYIWCRRKSGKGTVTLCYVNKENSETYNFSNSIGTKDTGEWYQVKLRLGGWNKEKRIFDINNLINFNFVFYGTGSLEIGEIGLLCQYQKLNGLLNENSKTIPVGENKSEIKIDGTINTEEWADAAKFFLSLPEKDSTLCKQKEALEKTECFITWNNDGIYCAARCFKTDMKNLKARYMDNAERIWEDECIEYYFDPDRKMETRNMKKFAINANGKTGIANYKDRDKVFTVSAKKFDDRWESEIFFPWETLGVNEKAPFPIGFNMTRTTYEGEKLVERTGWATTVWSAVNDFGIALINKSKIGTENSTLGKGLGRIGTGKYVITGNTGENGLFYKLNLFTPKTSQQLVNKSGELKKGFFEISFKFQVTTSGAYPLNMFTYDEKGNIRSYIEGKINENAIADYKPLSVDEVALFPEPKIFKREKGEFILKAGLKYFLSDKDIDFCGEKLCSELRDFYNIKLSPVKDASSAEIIFDLNLSTDKAADLVKSLNIKEDFEKIKYDGFLIAVTQNKILLTAKEKRGLLYAVNALTDLIKMTSGDCGNPKVCCVKVVDWPHYNIRFWEQMVAAFHSASKNEVGLYNSMLEKIVLRNRYNCLAFQVDDFYQWECAPKMRLSQAWTPEDYRQIIKFVNKNYVPVMPMIQSHGHMSWWLIGKKYGFDYLAEDGATDVICTKHPDSYKVLFSFYDEAIRMCSENPEYKPRYFNTSLDEVRWKTSSTPPEKRCKYCEGVPKNEIFLEHIKNLNKHIQKNGLNMIMCTDMISEPHNGLNEFKCSQIRNKIPRDVIMGHWSEIDYPEISIFSKLGFENWKMSTAYKINRLNEEYVTGHIFNNCTYNWWLTYTRCVSQASYGPMAMTLYANGIWNMFPDNDNTTWRKYTAIYGNWLMRNWSRKPILNGTDNFSVVDMSGAANDIVIDEKAGDGKGWFDKGEKKDLSLFNFNIDKVNGIPVKLAQKDGKISFIKFSKLAKETVNLNIGKKAAGIILFHAADIEEKDWKNFRDRKNYNDPLKGFPIIKYTVIYENGETESFAMLFGWNIAPWQYNPNSQNDVFAKYVIDARSLIEGKTKDARDKNLPDDIVLYQYEWVNPKSDIAVKSVKIEGLGTHISYGLLSLTIRNGKKF